MNLQSIHQSMRAPLVRALVLLAGTLAAQAASAQMPVIELAAGVHRIEAEVASTYGTRSEGLMHRRKLADGRGMLFVFPLAGRHCMWMRNTLIPLSVAFLDEQGVIVNVEEMKPETDGNHCADKPARYALETNTGWFSRQRLGVGTRISGIERAPAPR